MSAYWCTRRSTRCDTNALLARFRLVIDEGSGSSPVRLRPPGGGSSLTSKLDASHRRMPVPTIKSANAALRSPCRPRHAGSGLPSGSSPRSPTSRQRR
jgi:hypothetical protein